MRLCFVIQPFDGGPFDARYQDTLVPAIRAAGFEPYRVDHDPSVAIPIDHIERMIRHADACIADITVNNPNVWLELGLAFATGKSVLLIAKITPRKVFPFDVQHRHIVRYRTEAERDFQHLRGEITKRLSAITTSETAASSSSSGDISIVDESIRLEVKRAEALRRMLSVTASEKDAFFSRLQLIGQIRANRAYENVDEAGLAQEIHKLAIKEANTLASRYGLMPEWREWLKRRNRSLIVSRAKKK